MITKMTAVSWKTAKAAEKFQVCARNSTRAAWHAHTLCLSHPLLIASSPHAAREIGQCSPSVRPGVRSWIERALSGHGCTSFHASFWSVCAISAAQRAQEEEPRKNLRDGLSSTNLNGCRRLARRAWSAALGGPICEVRWVARCQARSHSRGAPEAPRTLCVPPHALLAVSPHAAGDS